MTGFSFPEEFVFPAYAGGSIANVPATVAAWLGCSIGGLPALAEREDDPVPAERVVLIIVDGLGWNLLSRLRDAHADLLSRAVQQRLLTSIFPSTTVAALSTFWTGLGPAGHGLVGLRIFLPEFGTLAQMLKLSPEYVQESESLVAAGLEPRRFLNGPGFAEQLAQQGVPTYVFKQPHLINSALSKMHARGVHRDYAIQSVADMMVQIRRLLEARRGEPLFVSAYWPAVDTLLHHRDVGSDSVAAEADVLLHLLEKDLLLPLEERGWGDTLICVVADHGLISTPMKQRIFLADHPALRGMLFMRPAGEPRAPYLYVRAGAADEALAYLREELGHAAVAWPVEQAVEAGLFGPEPHAPATRGRLGDIVVAMRSGYVLLTADEPAFLIRMHARHGSLTPDEMQVPWFVFRV